MPHVSRRLSIRTEHGDKVLKQEEFLAMQGPLVVLGEPGAGKSELVRQLKKIESTKFYTATSVMTFPTGIPVSKEEEFIVIDGLDEVTAYAAGAPIAQVLAKIPHEDVSRFVFTCRSVDWNHHVNSNLFLTRWKRIPIIGKLLPLSDQEIIEFVHSNFANQNGEEFLKDAGKHDSIELVRNPQMLLMLMKTISSSGWPKTRLEIYRQSCKALVDENSAFHRTSRGKYNSALLLNTAQAISAQMILANKSYVSLDDQNDADCVSINALSGDNYDFQLIRATLSTKLFRSVNEVTVECSHRTILEYLAAGFIATRLRDGLSFRRLETILYANGYIVPPALRGLHAWLATIDNGEIARSLIDRDPYGVFRYGDSGVLSVDLSRHLLKALRKLSVDDPHFRNEDWYLNIGKGLAKPELREDIVDLLRDPNISYELTHLVLESLKGQNFVNSLVHDLSKIIATRTETFVERRSAIEAMVDAEVQPNWRKLVSKLVAFGDMDSLRLALDIVEFKPNEFTGKAVANVLIAISIASRRSSTLWGGIGYGLEERLNNQQLQDALKVVIHYKFGEGAEPVMQDDPKDWISRLLTECFKRNILLDAGTIWTALNRLKRHYSSNRDKLRESAAKFFSTYPNIRLHVQWIGLFRTGKDGFWTNFYRLEEACQALAVSENDVILHLRKVMNERGENWQERWKGLAWYVVRKVDFKNANFELEDYANSSKELGVILSALKKPVDLTWQRSERREMAKWQKKEADRIAKRQGQYSAIIRLIRSGKHLQAISNVAKAYLRWFSDIPGDSPEDRVASLVGEKNKNVALSSIAKAIESSTIPTAKEIIEARINRREYWVEPILIVYYSRHSNQSNLPINIILAALASCRWGLHFHSDHLTPAVQADLEEIVFRDFTRKEQFLRDTFEPQISSSVEHISGLERLSKDKCFSDIAGELSQEWLHKYLSISDLVLENLLKAATAYLPDSTIISLAISKVDGDHPLSANQLDVWLSLLFFLDFELFHRRVQDSFDGKSDRFWTIKDSHEKYFKSRRLSAVQNRFIVKSFSSSFEHEETSSGFVGNRLSWEASEYLRARINELANDLSDEGTNTLKRLIDEVDPSTRIYKHSKHIFSEHLRSKAEAEMSEVSFDNVKSILFNYSPLSPRDLQSVLLDQLSDLQRRLKGSATDDYKVFWKEDLPQTENYCRNRIIPFIEPYLSPLGIRMHVESQMPNVKRCDFLNTCENMDLPVEIKGQWHKDLWTAAITQLEDYSNAYRAGGYGIYLVLWFGLIPGSKSPRRHPSGLVPNTSEELYDLLIDSYKEKVSERTRIFVLDVSKPERNNKRFSVSQRQSSQIENRGKKKKQSTTTKGSKKTPKKSPASSRSATRSTIRTKGNTRSARK